MESTADQVRSYEAENDIVGSLTSGMPINPNLEHLTLSETVLKYLDDPVLSQLKPIADQIIATNSLNDHKANYYKATIDQIILRIKILSDEDNILPHNKLEVARFYLHNLIDGSVQGFRARLATETTRRYISQNDTRPEKRSWWPF